MNLSEENLKIDRETMERTNPIFNTAKSTTYEIAMSGDPDALKLVEALGMTREATQMKPYFYPEVDKTLLFS